MSYLAFCVSLLIECGFWVNRLILSDFRCHPVRKIEGCTLPKRPLILRSQIITLIVENRGPYYASSSQKRRNVTFLPSEITHFCHRRPMFQIQQRRSDTNADTASFATKPEFTSCPLIGQSSSWRTAAMVPTRVGTRQCRFRTLTPHGEV